MNSAGGIAPVANVNGQPLDLTGNATAIYNSGFNAVNAINDVRADYFSQQANNASYDQMVMSSIMPVASNGGG